MVVAGFPLQNLKSHYLNGNDFFVIEKPLTDENKHSGHLNDHKTYYITVKINFQTVKNPDF
jgi:hypothetical protein